MEREQWMMKNLYWRRRCLGHQRGYSRRTAKKIGVSEQTLHEMCIQYFDFLDVLQTQLADDGKLSRATETEVRQAVLDAAKYAPAHFKIFD